MRNLSTALLLTLAVLGGCHKEPDKCFMVKPVEVDVSANNGPIHHYTKADFPIKMVSDTTYMISNARYETTEEPCHE